MLNEVETFLEKGAAVYFAVEQDKAIATCMVVPREGQVWEICKLAAEEHCMGKRGRFCGINGVYELCKRAWRKETDDCIKYRFICSHAFIC